MIAIIDYGVGNLRSVSKALESVGARVSVISTPEKIAKAKAIVLPGVGAFHKGMGNLKRRGLLPPIFDAIKEGKPFLGICLGLQLLFTQSEEHGSSRGLNIIRGVVKRFRGNMKIPHMGWNQIKRKTQNEKCRIKLLEGIPDSSYFYFAHSYYVEPDDKDVIGALTLYGNEFTSLVIKDNIFGVQFHPEKSNILGLNILKNFVRISSDIL